MGGGVTAMKPDGEFVEDRVDSVWSEGGSAFI